MSEESKCPVTGSVRKHAAEKGTSNRDSWPNQLDLKLLHQHSDKGNPPGEDFNYAEEFQKLDLDSVKKDIYALMTSSQNWWPDVFQGRNRVTGELMWKGIRVDLIFGSNSQLRALAEYYGSEAYNWFQRLACCPPLNRSYYCENENIMEFGNHLNVIYEKR